MIGTTELLLVAGLALLLFGGKKLPEMMKGMGQGVKSFKEGLNAPAETPESTKDSSPESAEKEAVENPAEETIDKPRTQAES